jgi:lysyl-tRNA synthetase class 2
MANGYSELNDPSLQEANFSAQQALRERDSEAMPKDGEFLRALEHGMPPAAGLGVGVDRLVMWLLGKQNIQHVLLFPTTKQR